jgi:acyl-CoA oxidase
MGTNGRSRAFLIENRVDNGRLWFDHVRIPRENLLNRHGSVSKDGTYSSSFPKESDRFTANIGELLIARMMIGVPSIHMMKVGLLIAVKYACRRRQFGMPNEPEVLLMDYLTHQKRLLPHLANCYALNFFCNYCKDRFANRTQQDIKEIHVSFRSRRVL